VKFRTEIEMAAASFRIDHKNQIMTLGSCFAGHINTFFGNHGFNVLGNPFGVLYNPVSLENCINVISQKSLQSEEDLVFFNEEWHSFLTDSQFSNADKQEVLNTINQTINQAHQFVKSTDIFIITLGTSFVYRFLESGKIVSNCHKIPQKSFEHFRLNSDEISSSLNNIIQIIDKINSSARCIFTVSPVRHWKNGAHENQLSKSLLLTAIDALLDRYPQHSYFPAYELLMDDLRDYRYYESDMLHPNNQAVDYILNKFGSAYFNEECIELNKKVEALYQAREHRPRNPNASQYKIFLQSRLKTIEELSTAHPYLDLLEYREYFKKFI